MRKRAIESVLLVEVNECSTRGWVHELREMVGALRGKEVRRPGRRDARGFLLSCNAKCRIEQVRKGGNELWNSQGRLIGDSSGRIFGMKASICRSALCRLNGGMRKRWSVWTMEAGRMGTTDKPPASKARHQSRPSCIYCAVIAGGNHPRRRLRSPRYPPPTDFLE